MTLRSFLQLLSSIALMGWVAPLSLPPLVVCMLGFYLLFNYFQVRQSSPVNYPRCFFTLTSSPPLRSLPVPSISMGSAVHCPPSQAFGGRLAFPRPDLAHRVHHGLCNHSRLQLRPEAG